MPEVQCGYVHLHLARVYFMLGDMDKTMEYLDSLNDRSAFDIGMINELKHWSSYDLVREPSELTLPEVELRGTEFTSSAELMRKFTFRKQ